MEKISEQNYAAAKSKNGIQKRLLIIFCLTTSFMHSMSSKKPIINYRAYKLLDEMSDFYFNETHKYTLESNGTKAQESNERLLAVDRLTQDINHLIEQNVVTLAIPKKRTIYNEIPPKKAYDNVYAERYLNRIYELSEILDNNTFVDCITNLREETGKFNPTVIRALRKCNLFTKTRNKPYDTLVHTLKYYMKIEGIDF